MESNFRKALKEVIGIDKSPSTKESDTVKEQVATTSEAAVSQSKEFKSFKDLKSAEDSVSSAAASDNYAAKNESPISQMKDLTLESLKDTDSKPNNNSGTSFSGQNEFIQPSASSDVSVITKTTRIEGSIVTDSNIVIAGEMIGNVTSSNSVSSTGRIMGNITCKNFEGSNAKIEGDVKVENTLIIKNNCDIIGDISAKRIELSGRLKGNIALSGEVFIAKEAYIIGNVTATTISIEKGAIIQGLIKIKTE